MVGSRTIDVLDYRVVVGADALKSVGAACSRAGAAHRIAIISDDQVARHWLGPATAAIAEAIPGTTIISTTVPAGEASKDRAHWAALTDWLLASGAGRDTTVIALGGGVVGDLAGFVAATYLRGVPVIQVPTSLLAMVDASIGGKTGVDTPRGKNLVGAFHQPRGVFADLTTLATLPPAHLRAGIAEVLKHGAIADSAYFQQATLWAASAHRAAQHGAPFDWCGPATLDVVARSVAIKADAVTRDPLERGRRQLLNAGHTVAHALERETDYALLHGEAVSIGLVVEALLGEAAGVTSAGTAEALRSALGGAGLPTRLPAGLAPGRMIDAMRVDKKSRAGALAFTLLAGIGTPSGSEAAGWTTALDERLVRDVLAGKEA